MSKLVKVLFWIFIACVVIALIDPTDWSKIEGRNPITGKTAEETTDGWFGKDWYGPRPKKEKEVQK